MNQIPDTGTLHILNKAPGHPRFVACLAAMSNQDTLILIENAVLALPDTDTVLPRQTLALEPDLEARGLSGTAEPGQQISHQQLVQLTEQHPRIISW
ncbi:MAG: protein of unknown function involved in oxidation of intracellular sulfur [Marinobacter excellens HL-55]|uniref:tRNA 2-thiouridine synthesizing protein B n=1 Tax=Marinobacter excellens HL-55 TaxID=1305731 RepID=A0A0P8D313_9GAMM|nr:MAG: protein of unknown function involved in oxidation of intracellular sulfur [Marinobacter excellens HL-55]